MEHTKGPWQVDETWGLITADNGLIEVAACHAGKRMHYKKNTRETAQANARLIAAAPEMLEALKRLAEHVYRANKDYEALSVAQGAIAKAEGK